MNIIKFDKVDFEYLGLAYFAEDFITEMKKFYNKLDEKLDKVVIDHNSGVYEVGIRFRIKAYFAKR